MNLIEKPAHVLVPLGFLLIAATGVDLTISRTGFGLLVLALGALFLGLGQFCKGHRTTSWILPVAVVGGAGYFIWRAFSGGPEGLAFADVSLVVIFLGGYFCTATGSPGLRRILIGSLALLCLLNLGVAAAQIGPGEDFYVWRDNPTGPGNTTGLFGHYNPFASFLNGSFFLFLSFAFLGKGKLLRISSGLLALCLVAAVVLSGSKGGWVSLLVGGFVWVVVVLIFLRMRDSRFFGPSLICAIILVIAGIFSSVWVLKKLTVERNVKFTGKDPVAGETVTISDGGRLVFQQMAIEIFQKSPVIGNGPRSFSYLALDEWDPDELWIWMGSPEFAHNEYLQALADYGLVGFLIIFLLLMAHVMKGFVEVASATPSRVRSFENLLILKIGALAGLVAILSHCFFDFLMHVPSCILLMSLLLGLLSSKENPNPTASADSRRSLRGILLLLSAVSLAALGIPFSKSFLLHREADQKSERAAHPSDYLDILPLYQHSAELSRDFDLLGTTGRQATVLAIRSSEVGDQDLAGEFWHLARDNFKKALALNPHYAQALVALPRVNDSLGEFAEANAGYDKAMKQIAIREYHLKSYFYAARSASIQGAIAEDSDAALKFYRLARERLLRRRQIVDPHREQADEKSLRENIEAWIAFLEGERLALEGDRIWKKARPRHPELAYALLLAAAERYQASAEIMEPLNSRWRTQWAVLQRNLKVLEDGRIRPATLSEEDLSKITDPDPGLDPAPATR